MGNEGSGMSDKQLAVCDFFVYIPQYSNSTASLNVLVAGSIIMHHFALFAGFQQAGISGYKFDVHECRGKKERFENPTEAEAEVIAKKREERARKSAKVD